MAPTLDITDARRQFNTLDERMRHDGHKVIHVTRHNRPAFAVVDIEYLEAVLETIDVLSDPQTIAMLQESIADLRHGRLHDHEDVKEELL